MLNSDGILSQFRDNFQKMEYCGNMCRIVYENLLTFAKGLPNKFIALFMVQFIISVDSLFAAQRSKTQLRRGEQKASKLRRPTSKEPPSLRPSKEALSPREARQLLQE